MRHLFTGILLTLVITGLCFSPVWAKAEKGSWEEAAEIGKNEYCKQFKFRNKKENPLMEVDVLDSPFCLATVSLLSKANNKDMASLMIILSSPLKDTEQKTKFETKYKGHINPYTLMDIDKELSDAPKPKSYLSLWKALLMGKGSKVTLPIVRQFGVHN